jgi:hypothetical protein
LNRVPRYVNWTAKKGLQKAASCFADRIYAEPSQIVATCRLTPTPLAPKNHAEIACFVTALSV